MRKSLIVALIVVLLSACSSGRYGHIPRVKSKISSKKTTICREPPKESNLADTCNSKILNSKLPNEILETEIFLTNKDDIENVTLGKVKKWKLKVPLGDIPKPIYNKPDRDQNVHANDSFTSAILAIISAILLFILRPLIFAALLFIVLAFCFALLALIFGLVALRQLKKQDESGRNGKFEAWFGTIIGFAIVTTVTIMAFIIF